MSPVRLNGGAMKETIEVDIKVPNQTRYLGLIGKIGEDVARTLRKFKGDREELAYQINTVLTEAMANAIIHANEHDPDKEVHVKIQIRDQELCIYVYDQGQGFDISLPPKRNRLTGNLDEHGRGIFIIHSLMDRVSYAPCSNGHVLEMIKKLK